MKIAVILFGWVYLIWFALDQRKPAWENQPSSPKLDNESTQSPEEIPEDLSPPLPPDTQEKLKLIAEILTGPNLDFSSLWTSYPEDLPLRTLILERWIDENSAAAMMAARGDQSGTALLEAPRNHSWSRSLGNGPAPGPGDERARPCRNCRGCARLRYEDPG